MANVFVNPSTVASSFDPGDATYWASTHLEFLTQAYRRAASPVVVSAFPASPRKGTTIDIRFTDVPQAGDYFEGEVQPQPISQQRKTLAIEHHLTVTHVIRGDELTLKLDDFNETVMRPAMQGLADALDVYVMSKARLIPYTNAEDLTPAHLTTLSGLEPHVTNLYRNGAPTVNRYAMMDPQAYLKAAVSPDFAHANVRGSSQTFDSGVLRPALDIDFDRSQGVGLGRPNMITSLPNDNRHKAGTLGASTVNGAVAEGVSVMNADGAIDGTYKPGDLFVVDGVTGSFVVTNAGTADGTGAALGIQFDPAAPAGGFPDGAAVTFAGDHVKNLVAGLGCIVAAAVPAALVPGQFGARIRDKHGFSFTWQWHQKDAKTGSAALSFEMFVGAVLARPEFGSILMTPYQ